MGNWIINAGLAVEDSAELTLSAIFYENGFISKIVLMGTVTQAELDGHEVLDAEGKLVTAGLIDMHVHFREPGFEYKETIATGTHSAARGGFTTVAAMPNTRPVIDNVDTLKTVYSKAEAEGIVRVLSYACITKGELGREHTDFAALKEAGAIGFTDDGVGVQSAAMMREAMKQAAALGLPIIAHCEDDTLIHGAPVTEGVFAEKHGLKGIPNESEAIHVARDSMLAETTGVHYHVCHVSAEQSARQIRLAKQHGAKVTAEVCPHHLLLSDEDIPGLDANWKMNPPLRSPKDVQAMIDAVEDGTIDIFVTDHAPHSEEEKAKGMMAAPFGIVGLETAFPLLYTKFVETGKWSLKFVLDRMTSKPAELFNLPTGVLAPGRPADIAIIDLNKEKEVDPSEFASKGRNTPFTGWKLKGWPVATIVGGKLVWSESRV
ncbi:dihydroorotase [Paenibacillus turpanensis]|uniref:dihydroorotase n=1 Tax=Paenibacillus turpanensis TaxID=2689078 RepID=UPI00140CCCE7|nr:dihydroorotase [Paenibacillus turpanensis]